MPHHPPQVWETLAVQGLSALAVGLLSQAGASSQPNQACVTHSVLVTVLGWNQEQLRQLVHSFRDIAGSDAAPVGRARKAVLRHGGCVSCSPGCRWFLEGTTPGTWAKVVVDGGVAWVVANRGVAWVEFVGWIRQLRMSLAGRKLRLTD